MKNKIKVCHLTSAHNSHDVRIFEKECMSLASDERYEVYLVAVGESRIEANVNVIGIGNSNCGRLGRIVFTARDVYKKALSLEAGIYHIHDPELLPYAIKLKKSKAKVIFDSHENYTKQIEIKEYIPRFMRKIIARFYYAFETHVVKVIDGVIITENLDIDNYFFKRCKNVEFIDNTPKLSDFYKKTEARHVISEFTVSCIGSLTEARGIEQLIEACYKANVKLTLAGNFSPESFGKRMRELKEFECVDYRGYCSRKEVLDILKESNIGASTILNVGQYANASNLPTKVYEYMMSGIPVIISDYPYARKLNEELSFGILIDANNVDSIVDGINQLKDESKYTVLAQNGEWLAVNKFNWEKEFEKLLNLYDKIFRAEVAKI